MKSHDKLAPVDALLQEGVDRGVYTAAQAAWSENGGPVETRCAGEIDGRPTTPEAIFDIASITKVFTASALFRLVSRGEMDLAAPLSAVLPCPEPLGAVTLERLLAHESGLPAWLPLFESIPAMLRGTSEAAARMQREICTTPISPAEGVACYSDLGFILLGAATAAAAKTNLRTAVEKEVCSPLGLRFHFRPVGSAPIPAPGTVAPTEQCPWRNRRLRGEVHDDNAWTMGGVAGHAGLFGNASDAVLFGNGWLRALDTGVWLDADTAKRAVGRRASGRGLGWDLKSPTGSSAGGALGDDAFGHLGFTGCSLWIDPRRRLSVALLTNRVFFGRENHAIRRLRPAFHDTLVRCLDGPRPGTGRG